MSISPSTRHADLFLALDQGGHASRAVLFDRRGRAIRAASVAIATHHPAPDRVEHDAEQVVESLHAALAEVLQYVDVRQPLRAAGLATQRSSIVCWNRRNGRALSPVISWQDHRHASWLQGLHDAEPMIHDKTGLVLSPHYGASKLRWCLDHVPAVQQAQATDELTCGPLASFLSAHLTRYDTALVDPANAARTSLFNLAARDWDAELLQLFGIPAAVLPFCVPSRHHYGRIATTHGTVPLTVVTGDQAAALFGFGSPDPAVAYINIGTGAFIQRPLATRPPPSRLLTSLAYDDGVHRTYTLEGTVNGAGSALAWVCAQLQIAEINALAQLPGWLESETAPPLFLNGVGGLGSPYWTTTLIPQFSGVDSDAAKLVAVIESIAFLIQVNLEAMTTAGAPALHRVLVSGGLAQLDGLCQRLADLGGVEVARPRDVEATARGVASLAAGTDADFAAITDAKVFLPATHSRLTVRYHAWRGAMEDALSQHN